MDIPAEVHDFNQVIAPRCLRPGDLLLTRAVSNPLHHKKIELEQKKFCLPQHAMWVHATLVRQDYQFMEMTTNGLNKGFIWQYCGDHYETKIRRIRNIGERDGMRIVDFAWDITGLLIGYDFWSIVKLKFMKLPNDLHRPSGLLFTRSICSAFYVKAVQGIGVDLGRGKNPQLVTPGHLSAVELMEDVNIEWIEGRDLERDLRAAGSS